MAFSDDSGADLESLADDRLGWATPALHHGLEVEDGDTSDHAVTLPARIWKRRAAPGHCAACTPLPASSLAQDPTLPDNGSASRSAAAYDDSP